MPDMTASFPRPHIWQTGPHASRFTRQIVVHLNFRSLERMRAMPATVTLPALLALFKIDRDLHQLQVGLENAQKEEKLQQAKIARLAQELETQDLAHKKLMADISTREMEIKTRQEHIEKMRGLLGGTKTDKEYKQILVQISAEKAE